MPQLFKDKETPALARVKRITEDYQITVTGVGFAFLSFLTLRRLWLVLLASSLLLRRITRRRANGVENRAAQKSNA